MWYGDWLSVFLITTVVLLMRWRGYSWPVTIAGVGALVALSLAMALLVGLLLAALS